MQAVLELPGGLRATGCEGFAKRSGRSRTDEFESDVEISRLAGGGHEFSQFPANTSYLVSGKNRFEGGKGLRKSTDRHAQVMHGVLIQVAMGTRERFREVPKPRAKLFPGKYIQPHGINLADAQR